MSLPGGDCEEFYRNGSKRVCSACGHSSDWLVMRQVGVSIRSHLGSTCWHYTVTFSLVRVSVSSKQLKDGCLYHLRGKQDLALKLHCCFLGLFLHCLPIPSLPWLAVVSAYSFELRESHEGWMMPRSGGHRKAFVPIIPAGSCSISIPGKVSCLRQGCSKENCTLLPSVWNNTACWLVGRIQ